MVRVECVITLTFQGQMKKNMMLLPTSLSICDIPAITLGLLPGLRGESRCCVNRNDSREQKLRNVLHYLVFPFISFQGSPCINESEDARILYKG